MNERLQHLTDDQLQAYLDKTQEHKAAEITQAHLDGCPTCQAQLSLLVRLTTQLEAMPEIALQQDLSQTVIKQLKDEETLAPAVTWTLVIEALAAGIVLGMLIPALQAAGWLPRLVNTSLTLQAAVNLFFTQLASSWLVWWAELKLQLNLFLRGLNPLDSLLLGTLSPWILIGAAGGLMILINALLLSRQPLPKQNQNHVQV